MTLRAEIRDYPAFHSMPPHTHDAPSMNIVLGGGFVERIGRNERHYSRGYTAYFPAGVEHSQRFGGAPTRQIVFRPDDSWLEYLVGCRARLGEAPWLSSLTFRHLGDRLFHEIRMRDEFSDIVCEGILLEVVAQFGRIYTAARQPDKPPAWLLRVRDYLHAQAFDPIRMNQVARVAGRHEVHVAREFRRFYGTSVGAYLRKLRLESAAQRLAEPRADICEVALECGFSSHSHLCREFRQRFGITPAQYRSGRR
jgi:AraC family transcriptional regulator